MNKITKIFNNIGFYCSSQNDQFIPTSVIKSYQELTSDSLGYFIPYLVRNLKDNYKWEIGVGEVQYNDAMIVVKRHEISSSSNNNKKVNFTGNENEFYLFVNNTNFNSSFNNVVLKNDHFTIDNITTIYLVDNNEKSIDCSLPLAKDSRNVVIDIKALTNNHSVKVRDYNGEIFASTSDSIRLVSDGQSWYVLNNLDSTINFGTLSYEPSFSAQSTPAGNDYSFQYKDGNNLVGSELYWGSGNNNKLLLGSDSETTAHTVIPTSGSSPTLFNKDLRASDFIVYGSGQSYRNLFFSYDGRVGINIPSGSRPQTVFHVVNYSCSEILRLENRTNCQPAKFTIYHKPSSLNNGSTCSILNLAGRDSNNNQKDYASIHSIASDTTNGLGGIVLSVSSGNSSRALVSGDLTNISIGYDNNKQLNINNNGNVRLSGTTLDIKSSNTTAIGTPNSNITFNNANGNVTLNHTSLTLGSGSVITNGVLSANNLTANNITLPNVAPSSLLTLDTSRRIIPISGISINSVSGTIVLNNIQSNKLLSVDNNKNIVGLYNLDDYFLTEKDIIWNKYQARPASVCLKQITFDAAVPSEEYSIGDQVEITTDSGLIYRVVVNIDYNNNAIVGLIVDQNVTTNTVNNVSLVSITKGGYLVMQKSVTGAVSDSTSNILSIKPNRETVFNTAQKDIDFTVYGTDIKPALKIHANIGSVTRGSGIYYSYATKENSLSSIIVNSGGSGISNNFSTANYNYNINNNLFPAKVSSVGTNGRNSYYGTYDQNGNVKEWLESVTLKGVAQQQYAAGGSYSTSLSNLRGIQTLDASGFYNDVGFRVASLTNIVDSVNISNLDLGFLNIANPNNIADTGSIKIIGSDGASSTNESFSNLGVVDKNYRISTYEITNSQYSSFLNSVATGLNDPITSGLYHPDMSGVLGGINLASSNILNQYTVKNNMENKPVNFVSYINSLRFINWLENGAPSTIDPNNANSIINQGAYEILLDGDNNYYIDTNKNRKYFLPSLNQWHKAAYFEYKDSVLFSGSPVVTINTDTPYVVAVEKPSGTVTNPQRILADLTVSGWLVVDKIIVRDGTIRSSLSDIGFDPDLDSTETQAQALNNSTVPPTRDSTGGSASDTFWKNRTSQIRTDGVYGAVAPPLPPDGDGTETESSCTDPDLIASNNIPFWCRENGRSIGPYFY